jgi:hypothetical protein
MYLYLCLYIGKGRHESEYELQPWDIAYLINVAQSNQSNGKTDGQLSGQKALSAVSEYFPLESCIEGIYVYMYMYACT